VKVTAPTHPLYGLTFPLMGITTKPRLGRVCVVWLYPGIERLIPFAATSLSETPAPPSRCRLCVAGLQGLLTVVAAWDARPPQEADVDSPCSRDTPQPTARPPAARVGGGPLHVPPEAPSMAPQHLGATLSTTPQAQARQTSLQLLQEVWQDAPTAGEDDATPPRTACLGLCAPIDAPPGPPPARKPTASVCLGPTRH